MLRCQGGLACPCLTVAVVTSRSLCHVPADLSEHVCKLLRNVVFVWSAMVHTVQCSYVGCDRRRYMLGWRSMIKM